MPNFILPFDILSISSLLSSNFTLKNYFRAILSLQFQTIKIIIISTLNNIQTKNMQNQQNRSIFQYLVNLNNNQTCKSAICSNFLKNLEFHYHNEFFQEQFIMKLLTHIQTCSNSMIRIKYLYLLKLVLSNQIYHEDLELIKSTLELLHARITSFNQQNNQKITSSSFSDQYQFMLNIQLPMIIFLKKLIFWKLADCKQQTPQNQLLIQYRRLYKINDLLQFKSWFLYYQSHYLDHCYVQQIFQWFFQAIKYFWEKILYKVKYVNLVSVKYKDISLEECLFLIEAKNMQKVIHNFLSQISYYKLIDNSLRLKLYNVIKPQLALIVKSQKSPKKQKFSIFKSISISKFEKTIFCCKTKDSIYEPLLQKQ